MLCGSMLYLPFQTQKRRPISSPYSERSSTLSIQIQLYGEFPRQLLQTLNKLPMKVLIFHSHSAMAKGI